MAHYGLEPQVVMTYPLLVGVDGEEKMSKSRGNYIAVNDPPEEMFGKTMSIPDSALPQWWEMLVDDGDHPDDPMEWKLELARRVVERWHGEEGARRGEENFTRVVRRHEAPVEIEEADLPPEDEIHLPKLLVDEFDIPSTSQARALVDQGAVKISGNRVSSYDISREVLDGAVVQVGKRRFKRFGAP
jgi:tyrosyl-tRNA synthetase